MFQCIYSYYFFCELKKERKKISSVFLIDAVVILVIWITLLTHKIYIEEK